MLINNIGIHIKVSNFSKSTWFYESLGFKKVFEYGPDKKVKEHYSGAVYEHGGCKLEIAAGHRAVKPAIFKQKVKSSKISLMVHVHDLWEIMKRCELASI